MRAKIVLIRPVYEENVGLVARAMANFGFGELALVRPECDFRGGKAKSRAMRGKNVLLRAKEFGSIPQAVGDCTYAIATSAKKRGKRNAMSPEDIARAFGGSNAKIALVFGPEPSGLTNSEIAECDFVATIPACEKYPTLNLSHAACIMLYRIFSLGNAKAGFEDARPATKRILLGVFEKALQELPAIDDKKAVLTSFKALLARSLLSEKEAMALAAFFSGTGKALRGKG